MKRARPLLGTLVEVEAHGLPDAALDSAIDAAFAAIQQVQRLMSVHDARSQLTRLNRHAHQRAMRVHPWLYQVIRQACALHADTAGLFDCAVGHLLMRAGKLPRRAGYGKAPGGSAHIRLLPGLRIRYACKLYLDLGGIAKGFAVDQAILALQRHGASSASVNAGGDLRVYGAEPQPIYVRDPRQPQQLIALGELHNGAIATSATYFSSSQIGQQHYSALFHPASQHSLQSAHSYSVIAPSCMVADALTKALALSKRADPGLLRKHKAISAVL